ncbi:glycosyltransferase family 2 protein [Geoalkalibacter halelectricus]|uniref:Glycosyltransferase n=1 Tax=Geoalkalibacter halelectricus TaxID=2847045 RepID=A0ABY5ZR18_9BACT|nr:glycosyltransferase [Geoalkalibacter halelectricus]MDO3377971.1 glycosyltransferase [Geoalkalibacter halelectricus]UWZ81526.1 glycosyltransferase [Geoalkalibacter halelectricus]
MKLSVIVPAYRLAPYIHECLLSLLAQRTDFPFEVLVCNDASPDDTLAALQPLAEAFSNLRVLNNPENLGLIGTMGRLLAECRGQYIAYIDGDDLALPGKLQKQVDYLDGHPECGLVYHESQVFDSATGAILKHFSREYYNAAYIPQRANITHLIRYGVFLQAGSIMFRRHDRLQQSLQHGCRIICDYPWHIANAHYTGGTIDRLDEVLGRYRIHSSSFGAQTGRSLERRVTVTRELEQACRHAEALGIDAPIVAQGISHHRFSAALYFLRAGADELFIQMIEEAQCDGWYFDDRHRFAFEKRRFPEEVRAMLGWAA